MFLRRVSCCCGQVNWFDIAFSRCKFLSGTWVFCCSLHHPGDNKLRFKIRVAMRVDWFLCLPFEIILVIGHVSSRSFVQKRGQANENWTLSEITVTPRETKVYQRDEGVMVDK